MAELNRTISEQITDKLIGGIEIPFLTKVVELVAEQGVLKRGTILGKVTATGKFKKVLGTATDGSQNADCILRDTVDATPAINAVAYIQGIFNKSELIVDETDSIEKHEEKLRTVNIILTDLQ